MITRTISALVAAAVFVASLVFWGTQGLFVASSIVIIVCIYEYARLTLRKEQTPFHIQVLFMALCFGIYFASIKSDTVAVLSIGAASVVFLATALLTIRDSKDLSATLVFQNAGILGFFYCGIFPALAVRTLFMDDGARWFLGLLAIVFAGDTCAYLIGRTLGKRKLLEPVSPKKTVEGSFGGLVGSALAGVALWKMSNGLPLFPIVAMAVATGLFAQVGDLFESLLKRVADVKDSGRIMPGHGGALDRIDGILFAGPVYYILLQFLVTS